jgi:outer membrane cobalamin receptor
LQTEDDMIAKRITTVIGVLALVAPATGGCATGMTMGARQAATDRGAVAIDGKIIRSEARTLLELLQDDPLVRSILAGGPAGEHRGLVVLDGIALVDLQRLADIPLYDVRSVERLRGTQATSRYGSRASAGAIVIRTHQRDGRFPEGNHQ